MTARSPDPSRVPPGQGVTAGWPVLHVGDVPKVDLYTWKLEVGGHVESSFELTWDEFQALPRTDQHSDLHCVTGWSRLHLHWEGVQLRELAQLVQPLRAAKVVRFSDGGFYDTTVPLQIGFRANVLLADRCEGRPLPSEHGGPLRAVVPSLYGWKSCKWVRRIEFLTEEHLGFWEVRGYHDGADPWREQRLV